jgi:hypothetical protein
MLLLILCSFSFAKSSNTLVLSTQIESEDNVVDISYPEITTRGHSYEYDLAVNFHDFNIPITNIQFYNGNNELMSFHMYVGGIPLREYLLSRRNLSENFTLTIRNEDGSFVKHGLGSIRLWNDDELIAVIPWKYLTDENSNTDLAAFDSTINLTRAYVMPDRNRRDRETSTSSSNLYFEFTIKYPAIYEGTHIASVSLSSRSEIRLYRLGSQYYFRTYSLEDGKPLSESEAFPIQIERLLKFAARRPVIMTVATRNNNNNNNQQESAGMIRLNYWRSESGGMQRRMTLYVIDPHFPDYQRILDEETGWQSQVLYLRHNNRIWILYTGIYSLVNTYLGDIADLFPQFNIRKYMTAADIAESGFHELAFDESSKQIYCYGDNREHQCSAENVAFIPYQKRALIQVRDNGQIVPVKALFTSKHGSFFLSTVGNLYAMGNNGESNQNYLGLQNSLSLTTHGYIFTPTKVMLPPGANIDSFNDDEGNTNKYNYPDMVTLKTKDKRIIAFGLGLLGVSTGSLPEYVTPINFEVRQFANSAKASCYIGTESLTKATVFKCFREPSTVIFNAPKGFLTYLNPYEVFRIPLPKKQ